MTAQSAIIRKDSNHKYHREMIDYVSSSQLKKYKQSPLHAKESEPMEQTDAMLFGTAYHTFVLEPEMFESEYHIFDEKEIFEILISEGAKSPRSTKKYKEWLYIEEEKAAGKILLDVGTFNKLMDMKKRLFAHPYAKYLLTGGESELSIYTDFNGVQVKIRPDHMIEKKRIITDLKTTTNASIDKFPSHAADLGYHISAAMYTSIMEAITGNGMGWSFYFVAQETKKPYAFNIFKGSAQFMAQGLYEFENLLFQYKYCQETGDYRGYQVFCPNKWGVLDISLPSYKIKELEFFNKYE